MGRSATENKQINPLMYKVIQLAVTEIQKRPIDRINYLAALIQIGRPNANVKRIFRGVAH